MSEIYSNREIILLFKYKIFQKLMKNEKYDTMRSKYGNITKIEE